MVDAQARRKHIAAVISFNPIKINITREVREEMDGAYNTREVNIPEQTVRIFQEKAAPAWEASEASQGRRQDYFMLVPFDGDVKADEYNRDNFECNLGSFRVNEVVPQVVKGILCGYQCYLEKVY